MKMKKSLSVILSVLVVLLASCSNWMKDDNLYSDIENDVKVANAANVSVYVRYANSKMGSTEPSGYTTLKVDIPADISAVTSDDYGFVRWVAFSTEKFSTSKQHSDLFYDSAEKYARDYQPLELPSSEVAFEDPTSPSTKVTINTTRSDIFIMPLVANRPDLVTSVPSNGRTDIVKNSQIRILFSKPIDEASLKDEFGNSNIVVTSGSAVLTESSSELGAKDITENFNFTLSKTKKMLTISAKKDSQGNAFLFDSNSQITIKIYEDVCDTDGYAMNGKKSFSFTTGTKQDSLSPYIYQLTAGIGEDCLSYVQYNYDPDTNNIINQTDYNLFQDAAERATNSLTFYNNKEALLAQRVKDKINIYVQARDIAGSGGGLGWNESDHSENDVALIQIRASQYINSNGQSVTTSAQAFPNNSSGTNSSSVRAVQDFGYAIGTMDSSCKIQKTFEELIPTTSGTIFTYDLSKLSEEIPALEDGLIKIDLWAVDMVGNSGDTERYSSTYGNGYRSIFVVKDSTPPDPVAAKNKLTMSGGTNAPYGWYNSVTLKEITIQDSASNLITDSNAQALSSDSKKLAWAFKLGNDTNWRPAANATDTWYPIHKEDNGQPKPYSLAEATVTSDGLVYVTMCLKDDMDNVSAPIVLDAINYDNTAPEIPSTVGWVKKVVVDTETNKEEYQDIVATTNTTDLSASGHVLKIPFTEETAGLRRINVEVTKNGQTTKIPQSNYKVFYEPQSGTESEITIAGNAGEYKTFNVSDSNKITTGTLYIKGIEIGDTTGSYNVKVTLWDSSLNQSTTTSTISIDITDPKVKKLYIPNLKHSITATASGISTDSKDGWFLPREYIHGPNGTSKVASQRPGFIPLYIFVEEKESGVRVIEFESSDDNVMLFTSAGTYNGKTKLYWGPSKDNVTEIPESDYTITYSTNPVTKTITFNNDKTLKFSSDFVILVENIGFDTYRVGENKIKVKVHDLAARSSASENKITTVADSNDENDKITGVKSDSYFNVSDNIYTLLDRGTSGTDLAAQAGFTNEDLINLDITFKNENSTASADSGYNKIKLDGAKFTGATAVKIGDKTIDYKLSPDKTEITFIEKNQQGKPTGTYVVLRTDSSITISDIQLDSNTEEEHKVKIQAYDLTGWGGDLTPAEKTITIDTVAPVWKGKGLYSRVNSSYVTYGNVYPHPGSDGNEETYGVSLINPTTQTTYKNTDGMDILYFYKNSSSSYINIAPDYTDDNFANVQWTADSASTYKCDQSAGTFEVYMYDKAGNKSAKKIKFVVVNSTGVNSGAANLENDVELIPPSGYDKDKNAYLLPYRSDMGWKENTYVYWGTEKEDKIKVFNYVLKKAPNGQNYKLKIDVSPYVEANTTSAPIESYGITTVYSQFPSTKPGTEDHPRYDLDPFVPNLNTVTWRDYNTKNAPKEDYEIGSIVDDSGCIVLTLPNHDLPPISLFLKNGVGKTTYVVLNPGLKAKLNRDRVTYESVGWFMDNEVGLSDFNSVDSNSINETSSDYINKPGTDVTFYKLYNNNTSTVKFGGDNGFSDTCRFDISSSAEANSTDITAGNYSMRSRILAWTESYSPDQPDFENATTTASDWYYYKEQLDNGNFWLENHLPKYDSVGSNGYGRPYKLYYIIEDRVGNFKIKQLKNGSTEWWLYDNTAPSPNVPELTNENKVNNIDGKNYYSSNSYVNYSIVEKGSGVKKDASDTYTYVDLATAQERTFTSQRYEIGDKTPSSGKLKISGIQDYAGNGVGSEVELSYNGSTTWVKQSAPELDSDNSTAGDVVKNDHPEWGGLGFDSKISQDGTTYTVQVSAMSQSISVTLRAKWKENDSTAYTRPSDNNKLLGWVIKTSQLESFKEFYTQSDVTVLEGYNNKYTFTKNDATTSWHDTNPVTYFYPVSRSGLICQTPIVVKFVENKVPEIAKNGSNNHIISFENVVSNTESGKTTYYIKDNSTIKFTTNDVILDSCTISVQQKKQNSNDYEDVQTVEYKGTDLSSSDFDYTLNLKKLGTDLEKKRLVLKLISKTEWGTTQYYLPDQNSNWTYDQTKPTVSFGSITNSEQVSGNTTYWVKNDNNVVVTVTGSDDRSDIKEYQMAKGSNSDSAFTTTSSDGQFTIEPAETAASYYFRVVDKAGNISNYIGSYTIQKDTTAPNATVKKEFTGTASYKSEDGNTTYYNSEYITKVTLSVTDPADNPNGVDLGAQYLYYKLNNGEEAAASNNKVIINLGAELSTCTLIIKDQLGNSKDLGTYTFNGNKPTGSIAYTTVVDGTVKAENTPDNDTDTIAFRSTGDNAVTEITLAATNVKDAKGNAAVIYYTTSSSSSQNVITDTLKLPCPTNASKTETYSVYAKDSLGNITLLRKFKLSGAAPSGTVTYTATAGDGTKVDGSDSSIIYFRSTGSSPITKIVLTSTVKDAGNNSDILYYQIGENTPVKLTKTDSGFELPCPSNENKEQTYKILAIDAIGNKVEITNFTLKGKAPTGSISSYQPKNATEATESSAGDYIITQGSNGSADIITYNPNVVSKVTFTPEGVTDCGAGSSIVVKINGIDYETGKSTTSAFDVIISSAWTDSDVMTLYVRDSVGNESAILKSLKFKTNKPLPSKVSTIKYNDVDRNHISDDTYSISFNPKIASADGGSRVYMPSAANFTITMNSNTVFFNKLYYNVIYSGSVPGTTAPTTDWAEAAVTNGKIIIPVDGTKLTSQNNYIFIWLKDMLGNAADYGLAYKGTNSYQVGWWNVDVTGPTGTITLTPKNNNNDVETMYKSDDTANGIDLIVNANNVTQINVGGSSGLDDAGAGITSKDLYYREKGTAGAGTKIASKSILISAIDKDKAYEIFAKDDFGNETIFKCFIVDKTGPDKSKFTVPDPEFYIENGTTPSTTGYISTTLDNGTIQLTYNTGLKTFKANITTTETDYKELHKIVAGNDNGVYNGSIVLSQGSGSSVVIAIKAYDKVWNETTIVTYEFKADDNAVALNQSRITTSSAFSGLIDSSKLAGTRDLAATQISTVPGRGIIMNKDLSTTYTTGETSGLTRAAKKAAKKAAKQAKAAEKAAKVSKSNSKAVEETPVVQEIVSQIEDLGITDAFVDSVVLEELPVSEQIIKEDISQVTAKTDFVMSPVEKVEIADTIESAASSAAQAHQEKSSSKAALIVVMLAILSAAAGAWYLIKGRIKQ